MASVMWTGRASAESQCRVSVMVAKAGTQPGKMATHTFRRMSVTVDVVLLLFVRVVLTQPLFPIQP